MISAKGKMSGQAYIIFTSQNESKRALRLNGQKIGQRYIELFISNAREVVTTMNTKQVRKT